MTQDNAGQVVVRYVARRNPEGRTLPAVPLRDLTTADWTALPGWLQSSVRALPWYEAEVKAEVEAEIKAEVKAEVEVQVQVKAKTRTRKTKRA